MSRSTIGGVVGAVIGFVVTGYSPQGAYWGWVIGSGVGALTDNTKTYGPRAGDASQQLSQDGTICTYGYGEFPTTGVVLWRDERREIEESQGKGGPTNVTFKYSWSYAIGVCKGPIGAYLIIKRNGTIVYDLRTDEELLSIGYSESQIAETRAAQAKFEKTFKLYYGDDEQMPDPTIQSVKGVDNVPAYRGRAYIVATDDDVTNDGAAIPQFEFVVAMCGVKMVPNHILVTGQSIDPGGPVMSVALINEGFPLVFAGIPQDTGANVANGKPAVWDGTWAVVGDHEGCYSTDNRKTWQPMPVDRNANLFDVGEAGWVLAASPRVYGSYDLTAKAAPLTNGFVPYAQTALPHFVHGEETYMVSYTGGYYYFDVGAQGFLGRSATLDGELEMLYTRAGSPFGEIQTFHNIKAGPIEGTLYATCISNSNGQLRRSADGGMTFPEVLVSVPTSEGHYPLQVEVGINEDGSHTVVAVSLGSTQVWTSSDDFSTPHLTGIRTDTSGTLPVSANHGKGRQIGFCRDNETFYIISGNNISHPELADKCVTTKTGIEFSAPASLQIRGALGLAISPQRRTRRGRPIPDAPEHYVDPRTGEITGPTNGGVKPCQIMLSELVIDQCNLRKVTRIISSELEDHVVRGFRVATQTSPKDNIRSLQGSYFFDASEYDGYLHFMRRPQPDTFLITMDDLVANDNQPIEWELIKENDLLRKVSVSYFDPKTNYTVTSQDYERAIATIKAQGEGVFDSAMTATADFTKQVCEKSILVAWAEKDQAKFTVRMKHAGRYTGEWGKLQDETGQIHVVRIIRIENDGILRHITVRKTRRSAYSSRAAGVKSPLPSFPGSGLRGPNLSVVMNGPALRVEDDRAGLYWACTGFMSGWSGAVLSLARDGVTFETGPAVTKGATMGWLTSVLPAASRYGMDTTNVLQVELAAGASTTLASTDYAGIQDERNVAALRYPDGKIELLQFMTVTPTGERTYALSNLMRGRKDTVAGEHLIDAEFVLMDDKVKFVAIRPDDVGKTLTFRAVSNGTDPDAAELEPITFTTIESLREWQPYMVQVTYNSDGSICVTWIGRGRLGTDRVPLDSQWFLDYEIKFDIGSASYTTHTTEQSICVDAATLAEAFPAGYSTPAITVRTRSRVATNDDDFDSPPGSPTTDANPSYPVTIVGEPGDMYEGEGVLDYLGPTTYISPSPPFQAYGGKLEERFVGEIVGNVTCQSSWPGAGIMVGIPLTAETRDADTTIIASGPDIGSGGPYTITDSVTVLAMPTFAMMDELKPWGEKKLITPVTSPPRTTKKISSVGMGGLKSRAGFSTGQRRCEFIIDSMPAGGRIAIGVLAAGENAFLAPGTGGTFAHIVTANGTFAVEVDASTGDVDVFELGVGLVASGTLPLTYAHDGKYRFAWVASDAQHPAASATVHTNQGNESWAITPTAGFGGVPNEANVIPCGFDAEVGTANGYWLTGTTSLTHATSGGFSGLSVVYAYAAFAKSTGTWRIGMGCGPVARIGLCKAGHTGLLGQGGDSFGMSYDFTVPGSPQLVFDTTWAGQIRIPHPFYTMDHKIIFVCDFDAHTVEVWGKPQFSDYILLTVLTGLPSGAWVPAGNHAVELINGASEIPGATDWSFTITP